jgi:peptide deformylase
VTEIRIWPDQSLQGAAEPVTEFDAALITLTSELVRVLKVEDAMGIAAPQLGASKQVIVVRLASGACRIMVNPVILESSGSFTYKEGCLSSPGVYCDITRPRSIKVRYQDTHGHPHTDQYTSRRIPFDVTAQVVQHELEHLAGTNPLEPK